MLSLVKNAHIILKVTENLTNKTVKGKVLLNRTIGQLT